MQFREDLEKQNRTDKRINLANYNSAIEKINALGCFNITDVEYMRWTGGGKFIIPHRYEFPWDKFSFGFAQIAKNIVRIYAGNVRHLGVAKVACDQTDVTLSGATEWIYCQYSKVDYGVANPSIQHSTNEPESTTIQNRVSLSKWEGNGGKFRLIQICHIGDIVFDTPVV